MARRLFALTVMVGLVALRTPGVCLGQGVFLQIPGVPGESTDPAHQNWIDVEGFGQGISHAVPFCLPPNPCSPADFQPIKILKRVDRSSPLLFLNAASGAAFSVGSNHDTVLHMTHGGQNPVVFLEIVLTDARIASVSTTADATGVPKELVALSFRRIRMTYTPFGSDGTAGQKVVFEWNLSPGTQ